MFGLLMSAIATGLAWFARAILFKAVLYIALFYITTEGIQFLADQIVFRHEAMTGGYLTALFSGLGGSYGYFFTIFRFDVGVPMILSAWVLRFAIRRLPVIG